MYYIGSHDGTIDDGYQSSSRWLNGEINYRPDDFRRKLLKTIDISEMKMEEYRIIKKIKESEFGVRYYNLKSGRKPGTTPWNKGKTGVYSLETINKMADMKKGKPSPTKGIPNLKAADNARRGAAKNSKKAMGRKRKYLPDGSWCWEYPIK